MSFLLFISIDTVKDSNFPDEGTGYSFNSLLLVISSIAFQVAVNLLKDIIISMDHGV